MRNFYTLALLVLSLYCHSQIRFEKGYFISNDGKKTECFIRNIDWKNNPSRFKYKVNENSEILENGIESVSEFGCADVKYRRFKVRIDRSTESISDLSTNPNSEFSDETLFLQLITEGKANLFMYVENDLKRFYCTLDNGEITYLEYKVYLKEVKTNTTHHSGVTANNKFRQQLYTMLQCEKISRSDFEKLGYNTHDLQSLFKAYNSCFSSPKAIQTAVADKPKKDFINLNIRPGLNFASADYRNDMPFMSVAYDFDKKTSFRIGIEGEFILPFNKNKWGILLEPTFNQYKSEGQVNSKTATIDYKSLEIPIGIRHYFFVGRQTAIFINASFCFDIPFSSTAEVPLGFNGTAPAVYDISKNQSLNCGFGFKYNKYSIEFKFWGSRDLHTNYSFVNSTYRATSIIFGYTLF